MAQQPKLLGREREHFNEEAFLQFFNFSSIEVESFSCLF